MRFVLYKKTWRAPFALLRVKVECEADSLRPHGGLSSEPEHADACAQTCSLQNHEK